MAFDDHQVFLSRRSHHWFMYSAYPDRVVTDRHLPVTGAIVRKDYADELQGGSG